MRIITGLYKGRHFDIPRSFKARPTTDFAKENIFNVMNGYVCFDEALSLDLFAGTGSISLELLSRGSKEVISIEADRDHAAFIRQCVAKIGAENHTLIRGDVFRFIKTCRQKFDIIFADPPYALPELPTIPRLIFERGLLKPDGILVFEHGKHNSFEDDPHFVEHRAYGSVNFSIFMNKEADNEEEKQNEDEPRNEEKERNYEERKATRKSKQQVGTQQRENNIKKDLLLLCNKQPGWKSL